MPFSSPQSTSDPRVDPAFDLDDEPPRVNVLIVVAALASGLASLVGLTLWLQMLLVFELFSIPGLFSLLMLAVTGGWLVAAALLTRGSGWAAIVCTVLGVVCTLIAPLWMGWSLYVGLLSLLSMTWGLPCLLAAALAPLSIAPARRISAHRRALYAS